MLENLDWGTVITCIITFFAGNLSTLVFFPQLRNSKKIDNESKQSEEWRKLYEEANEELKEERKRFDDMVAVKDNKIDALFTEISKHRDEKAEKSNKIASLEVENTRLCILKCEVPACPNRKPPTGY